MTVGSGHSTSGHSGHVTSGHSGHVTSGGQAGHSTVEHGVGVSDVPQATRSATAPSKRISVPLADFCKGISPWTLCTMPGYLGWMLPD